MLVRTHVYVHTCMCVWICCECMCVYHVCMWVYNKVPGCVKHKLWRSGVRWDTVWEREGGRGEEKGEGMGEEGREEQLSAIPFSSSILICTDLWAPPVLAIGISISMHFPIQDTMRFFSHFFLWLHSLCPVSSVVKLKNCPGTGNLSWVIASIKLACI